MRVEVTVPATLSNIGPGFDVLGMAVGIFNRFTFTVLTECDRYEAYGKRMAPAQHLGIKTVLDAAEAMGGEIPGGLSVAQEDGVPRSRGLGSSATARVAGFLAYQAISGVRPPLDDALAFLARGEGHPDNVVPALVGGFVACAGTADGLRHIRLEPPESLNVALCIPEKTVRTDAARRVLPAAYSREDVVFNTSRLAFTMIGLLGGRGDALAIGCGDRVHQPYRGPLIGPVEEAFSAAREAGAVSAFISGSGSTLAAFVLDPAVDPARVAAAMCERFSAAGLPAQPRVAKPESRGAFSTVIAP